MFKKFFLKSIFLCLLISTSYSQRVNFDQLKKEVLEAQTKREKAQAMFMLGNAISTRAPQITMNYADSILRLAEPDDSKYYKNASTYLTALALYRNGKLLEAKRLFSEVYDFFLVEDQEIAMNGLNIIGIIYLRTNSPDSAAITFNQILDKVKPENIRRRIGTYGNLGKAYEKLGNYEEAINNFQKCVELDTANTLAILNSNMSIAGIFGEMELYEKGIETLKSINFSNEQDRPIKASYIGNLGILYYQNGQYDSAVHYLNRGIKLAKKINQYQLTVKNQIVLSKIYLEKNQRDSALSCLTSLKRDLSKISIPPFLIDYNMAFSNFFESNQTNDSTIHYAKKAMSIANKHNLERLIQNGYQTIAKAYENKGIVDSSAYYYKLHADLQDILVLDNKEQFAQKAKARYLLFQKEKELADGEKESLMLQQWQKVLIVSILLLGIVMLYIFLRFKKSKTQALKESSQNEILSKEIEKNKNTIIELKSRAVISIEDIILIKADGHYLEFKLINKANPEIDRNQLKSILENLPSKFVQIHRSYAVNVDHIKIKQASKVILNDGTELPVSRTFKDSLNRAMNLT